MQYIFTPIHNNEDDIDYKIRSTESSIADYRAATEAKKQRITRLQEAMSRKEQVLADVALFKEHNSQALANLLGDAWSSPSGRSGNELINDFIEHRKNQVCSHERKIAELQNDVNRYNDELERLNNNLASFKQQKALQQAPKNNDIVIDPDELIPQLEKLDYVDSVTFKEHAETINFLVKCSGLSMSPSNEEGNAKAEEILEENCIEHLSINVPLENLAFEISIKKTSIGNYRLTAKYGRFIEAYDENRIIHPHWISNQNACFGDFNGPIHECLCTGDIVTTTTLIVMFLQQYDPYDCAGRLFYRWVMFNQKKTSVNYVNKFAPKEPEPESTESEEAA